MCLLTLLRQCGGIRLLFQLKLNPVQIFICLWWLEMQKMSSSLETSPPKEIISSKLANKQLTILIWNIDGLDEDFLKERTIAMVEEIHR